MSSEAEEEEDEAIMEDRSNSNVPVFISQHYAHEMKRCTAIIKILGGCLTSTLNVYEVTHLVTKEIPGEEY